MKCYFDPKCKELAEVFLRDEPKLNSKGNADWLATVIQEAIEEWFEDRLRELEWDQLQAAHAAQSIIEANLK